MLFARHAPHAKVAPGRQPQHQLLAESIPPPSRECKHRRSKRVGVSVGTMSRSAHLTHSRREFNPGSLTRRGSKYVPGDAHTQEQESDRSPEFTTELVGAILSWALCGTPSLDLSIEGVWCPDAETYDWSGTIVDA